MEGPPSNAALEGAPELEVIGFTVGEVLEGRIPAVGLKILGTDVLELEGSAPSRLVAEGAALLVKKLGTKLPK
jgi:hypothetical protein